MQEQGSLSDEPSTQRVPASRLIMNLRTDDGFLVSELTSQSRGNWAKELITTFSSRILARISFRLTIVMAWASYVTAVITAGDFIAPPEWGSLTQFEVPGWPHELIGGFLAILLVFRTDQVRPALPHPPPRACLHRPALPAAAARRGRAPAPRAAADAAFAVLRPLLGGPQALGGAHECAPARRLPLRSRRACSPGEVLFLQKERLGTPKKRDSALRVGSKGAEPGRAPPQRAGPAQANAGRSRACCSPTSKTKTWPARRAPAPGPGVRGSPALCL
jgi:hypothetical protein